MQIQKEKSFSNFKNLFSIFRKSSKNINQIMLENRVSNFIDKEMFSIVFEYMHTGYKLNPKQEKIFYMQLNKLHPFDLSKLLKEVLTKDIVLSPDFLYDNINKLDNLDKLKLLDICINKRIKLTDEFLAQQLPVYIRFKLDLENVQSFEGKSFMDLYKSKIESLNFKPLYENWVENVEYYHSLIKNPYKKWQIKNRNKLNIDKMKENLIDPVRNYSEFIFKDVSMAEIFRHLDKLEYLKTEFTTKNLVYSGYYIPFELEAVINKLKDMPTTLCNQEIDNDKKHIEQLYSDNTINQLLIEETNKMINTNNVNQLPQLAKEILNDIKKSYIELNKVLDKIDESEKFEVDNLWNKRIPEIINKYLSVPSEFRNDMKNSNGYTIEDLMIDSLNNIQDKLQQIILNHTQNVLYEMSAINRYTKAIK